jgi:hypothetical protein
MDEINTQADGRGLPERSWAEIRDQIKRFKALWSYWIYRFCEAGGELDVAQSIYDQIETWRRAHEVASKLASKENFHG